MTTEIRQRWSWWSGVSPVGVRSGLATYSTGLAAAVARSGVGVRGIGVGQSGDNDGVSWIGVSAETRTRGRALFSLDPYIANRLKVAEHAAAVDAELDLDPDVVVIDHLMSAWALDRAETWRARTGGKIVHVSHNDEALVRTSWAAGTAVVSPRGLYLRFDGWRSARLQRRVIAAADLVTMITDADAKSIASRHESIKSVVLTPGYSGPCESLDLVATDRPRSVLLFGSLDWEAKRQNVIEVVQALDPVFAEANIDLRVVGGGADDFVAAQHGKWAATTFTGPIDDLGAEFNRNRLGLVAEPIGGGFKLKSLDYAMRGLPIVVLDGSMSGLGLSRDVHYGSAASMAQLPAAVIEAIDDPEQLDRWSAEAAKAVEGRFEWKDRGSELVETVISLSRRH
ncbi:MAG: glycosyltransferase [Actinobacteria bacterium]|nr:glycosyltransferase [Actinomycetota bacterium]